MWVQRTRQSDEEDVWEVENLDGRLGGHAVDLVKVEPVLDARDEWLGCRGGSRCHLRWDSSRDCGGRELASALARIESAASCLAISGDSEQVTHPGLR
jgi:hypothetical protein